MTTTTTVHKGAMPPAKCTQGHTHQVFGCVPCNDLVRAWKRWTGTR